MTNEEIEEHTKKIAVEFTKFICTFDVKCSPYKHIDFYSRRYNKLFTVEDLYELFTKSKVKNENKD